jgi:thiamine thiazole synthase
MEKIFSQVGEKDITRAIVEGFMKEFYEYVESDCIIIGGGPSGLMAARDLANDGFKVIVIERNNYIGGGF